MRSKNLVLALLVFMGSRPALAEPIQLYLDDVNFTDGGAAFGSFMLDPLGAPSPRVTNLNIMTTAGSAFAGTHYSVPFTFTGAACNGAVNQCWYIIDVTNSANTAELQLYIDDPLDPSGRTPISTFNSNSWEAAPGPIIYRFITSGFVTTSVPEPSTWAMMLLGFGAFGFAGYWSARKGRSVISCC
jgi:hypothetical protein